MTAYRIAFIVLAMFLLSGCTPRGPKNPAEAAGEYIFPSPSGEVEVVILNSDLTYRQELHTDIASYRQAATPLHTNVGSWAYKRSVLTFSRWLDFFDYPNPAKRIVPPRQMASNSAHWDPPTGKVDARILISEEFHYVFLRVKNRSEGAKILEQVSPRKE